MEKWAAGGLSGGCKAVHTLYLILPYLIVHSIVLRWKLGWVEIIVFVRYTSPAERQLSILVG